MTFLICHVTIGSKYCVIFWVGPPHPESARCQHFGPCRYEDINIFVLSRDRMFFVSRDFEGGVPSSKVTTLVSLGFMDLVKVQI